MGNGFQINVSADLDALTASLDAMQRDSIPFWTSKALNDTAKEIKDVAVAEMTRVFDHPTRFTLNALYISYATKQRLVAQVLFKEGFGSIPASRYLGPQVEGGRRAKKSHERALERAGILHPGEFCLPGQGINLDAYGNIPGSILTRILSDLGASHDPKQNSTTRSRGTKKGRARGRYFVMRPGGVVGWPSSNRSVPPGIYFRSAGQRVARPVLIFATSPRYQARLPFYVIAKRVMQDRFSKNFRAAMQAYPHRYR